MSAKLDTLVKNLPASPGVYLMRDTRGSILYVGKAANLHNRVRSYFVGNNMSLMPKTQQLVAHIHDLDFFITNSEQEALILECNLIKRYRPRYNVRLKDDKAFPYLKIDPREDWPRLQITRRLEDDKARYFGPFASSWSVRQTVKVLKGIFRFRSCNRELDGHNTKPCLEYHIHNCIGPCTGTVSRAEYADIIKQVVLFLEGKQTKIVRQLDERMKRAAAALDFERAAWIRDQVQAINSVIEGQRIAARVRGEQDVIAFVTERDLAYVQVFFVRGGKLIGRESFVLQGATSEEPAGIMTSFVKQFYGSAAHIPPLLVLQHPVEERQVIEEWLGSKRGSRVRLLAPARGNKKQLLDIVVDNARHGLAQLKLKQQLSPEAGMAEIKERLDLPRLPERIECHDISNIQGAQAVGSMAVFENGKARPAHYRRFRIRTVAGADDYAMLREMLRRRFRHFGERDKPDAWSIVPDLVLIDGGKGQLNAARLAMQETGAGDIPLASLAKENEEIFLPGQAESLKLPPSSPGLQLLQRVRDEAHRFAVGYHRSVRSRESLASAMDKIPGIGPKRKRALLRQFGSVRRIREASPAELAKVKGITPELAQKIKENL